MSCVVLCCFVLCCLLFFAMSCSAFQSLEPSHIQPDTDLQRIELLSFFEICLLLMFSELDCTSVVKSIK